MPQFSRLCKGGVLLEDKYTLVEIVEGLYKLTGNRRFIELVPLGTRIPNGILVEYDYESVDLPEHIATYVSSLEHDHNQDQVKRFAIDLDTYGQTDDGGIKLFIDEMIKAGNTPPKDPKPLLYAIPTKIPMAYWETNVHQPRGHLSRYPGYSQSGQSVYNYYEDPSQISETQECEYGLQKTMCYAKA